MTGWQTMVSVVREKRIRASEPREFQTNQSIRSKMAATRAATTRMDRREALTG